MIMELELTNHDSKAQSGGMSTVTTFRRNFSQKHLVKSRTTTEWIDKLLVSYTPYLPPWNLEESDILHAKSLRPSFFPPSNHDIPSRQLL